jgi:hypothetical protein
MYKCTSDHHIVPIGHCRRFREEAKKKKMRTDDVPLLSVHRSTYSTVLVGEQPTRYLYANGENKK